MLVCCVLCLLHVLRVCFDGLFCVLSLVFCRFGVLSCYLIVFKCFWYFCFVDVLWVVVCCVCRSVDLFVLSVCFVCCYLVVLGIVLVCMGFVLM